MRGVRTIRDFDEALIAPLHGFRDAMDYYRRASSSALLRDMRVPTVIVHAEDDPLVPIEPVHDALATASKRVRFVITAQGGHVGFLAATPPPGDLDRFWAESRAADFVGRMVTGLEDHTCTLYTGRPKGQPLP
jgi:predicted alpha/beta-fold hydrolase